MQRSRLTEQSRAAMPWHAMADAYWSAVCLPSMNPRSECDIMTLHVPSTCPVPAVIEPPAPSLPPPDAARGSARLASAEAA